MQFLQELKIQKENQGSSTGAKWIQSKGEMISSFSPVDNQLIGAVVTGNKNGLATGINEIHKVEEEIKCINLSIIIQEAYQVDFLILKIFLVILMVSQILQEFHLREILIV